MIFEEVIEQDPTVINEEIIPLMNAPRVDCRGQINPYEPQAQKIYITTAGYSATFAYDKNIETLCYSVIDPDHYMVLGGSYIIPLMHGRLEEQTMPDRRDLFEAVPRSTPEFALPLPRIPASPFHQTDQTLLIPHHSPMVESPSPNP